jgi:hypothetical protein
MRATAPPPESLARRSRLRLGPPSQGTPATRDRAGAGAAGNPARQWPGSVRLVRRADSLVAPSIRPPAHQVGPPARDPTGLDVAGLFPDLSHTRAVGTEDDRMQPDSFFPLAQRGREGSHTHARLRRKSLQDDEVRRRRRVPPGTPGGHGGRRVFFVTRRRISPRGRTPLARQGTGSRGAHGVCRRPRTDRPPCTSSPRFRMAAPPRSGPSGLS